MLRIREWKLYTNIAESGIKHNKSNQIIFLILKSRKETHYHKLVTNKRIN
jgi:hypothetical protein